VLIENKWRGHKRHGIAFKRWSEPNFESFQMFPVIRALCRHVAGVISKVPVALKPSLGNVACICAVEICAGQRTRREHTFLAWSWSLMWLRRTAVEVTDV